MKKILNIWVVTCSIFIFFGASVSSRSEFRIEPPDSVKYPAPVFKKAPVVRLSQVILTRNQSIEHSLLSPQVIEFPLDNSGANIPSFIVTPNEVSISSHTSLPKDLYYVYDTSLKELIRRPVISPKGPREIGSGIWFGNAKAVHRIYSPANDKYVITLRAQMRIVQNKVILTLSRTDGKPLKIELYGELKR